MSFYQLQRLSEIDSTRLLQTHAHTVHCCTNKKLKLNCCTINILLSDSRSLMNIAGFRRLSVVLIFVPFLSHSVQHTLGRCALTIFTSNTAASCTFAGHECSIQSTLFPVSISVQPYLFPLYQAMHMHDHEASHSLFFKCIFLAIMSVRISHT